MAEKLLFFHNSLPEYRVAFFQALQKSADVQFVILEKNLQKKLYHTETAELNLRDLNLIFLDEAMLHFHEIKKIIKNYSGKYILLPPLDSFHLLLQALYIERIAAEKKVIYWSEKWEAPINLQPFLKKCKNAVHRVAFRVVLRRVAFCIASGTKAAEYLENTVGTRKKVKIAYDSSGANPSATKLNIRKKHLIPSDWKIVLYYGRIIPRKGLDVLIRACGGILKSRKSTLLVCGDGDFRPFCERLAKKMQIDNIQFAGWISPKDKYAYFSQSDIFVLPSLFRGGVPEAWGLTVNESLQCGTPVVATTAVGSAYDLLNGRDGCMVEENDPLALSEAIYKILNRSDETKAQETCLEAARKFSIKAMAEEFVSSLE
jgi:glycosyltransferase involved in cell wall biosynthesis